MPQANLIPGSVAAQAPGIVSFLLHMHDPDVARNKTTDTQVHWLVWNIPGTATGPMRSRRVPT